MDTAVLVALELELVRVVLVDDELDLCAATIQQPDMRKMRRKRKCIAPICSPYDVLWLAGMNRRCGRRMAHLKFAEIGHLTYDLLL